MKALAAEMVSNFGKRLAPLGIAVRELTGDMQLTKSEVQCTQVSSVVVVWVMVHVVAAHPGLYNGCMFFPYPFHEMGLGLGPDNLALCVLPKSIS